jgi:hypothetical protein
MSMADEDVKDTQEVEDTGNNDDTQDLSILSELDIPADVLDGSKADDKEPIIDTGKDKQELSEKMADYETRMQRLEDDKRNLKKALHEARQEKKAKKVDDTVSLTDADLTKIIEEHKDDPSVLLNAVTYKMEQIVKKGKIEAVDEVQVKQKANQLNNFLKSKFGDTLDDDSSELRVGINKAKDFLNVSDHPFGDAIGAAAVVFENMPKLLQAEYERGKNEALTGNVEKNRVSGIKNGNSLMSGSKRTDGGSNKATGLTESQAETAKQLGFKPGTQQYKIYVNQILKSKAA